jgi:8-amino-7-oxononanoate synthase
VRRGRALAAALAEAGLAVGPSAGSIVPLLLGTPERAAALAGQLRQHGLFVPAIRPPTVPAGTSRLRISLSAAHTDSDLAALVAALSGQGSRSS